MPMPGFTDEMRKRIDLAFARFVAELGDEAAINMFVSVGDSTKGLLKVGTRATPIAKRVALAIGDHVRID